MSELNYKELQEQGVFDVPYKAFEFMQEQQKKLDCCREENKVLLERIDKLEISLDARCKQLIDSEAYYEYEKKRADSLQSQLKGNQDD